MSLKGKQPACKIERKRCSFAAKKVAKIREDLNYFSSANAINWIDQSQNFQHLIEIHPYGNHFSYPDELGILIVIERLHVYGQDGLASKQTDKGGLSRIHIELNCCWQSVTYHAALKPRFVI